MISWARQMQARHLAPGWATCLGPGFVHLQLNSSCQNCSEKRPLGPRQPKSLYKGRIVGLHLGVMSVRARALPVSMHVVRANNRYNTGHVTAPSWRCSLLASCACVSELKTSLVTEIPAENNWLFINIQKHKPFLKLVFKHVKNINWIEVKSIALQSRAPSLHWKTYFTSVKSYRYTSHRPPNSCYESIHIMFDVMCT